MSHYTMIQNTFEIGQKYSTVPRAQERVSERASERVSAAERASEASSAERMSEQCERTEEQVAPYIPTS